MYTPILFIVCLLFFTIASATGPHTDCSNQTTISNFLSESFIGNVHFIRKGVPSEVVDLFYKRALYEVLPKCLCDTNTLSLLCTRLAFTSRLSIRALQALADLHRKGRPFRDVNLFPLYNPHASLPELNSSQTQRLHDCQQDFLHYVSSSQAHNFSPLDWTIRIFPTEHDVYIPEEQALRRACASYDALVRQSQLFFSAALTTAYAISVVQIVRFADGDVKAAMHLLHEHVKNVYDASLCLGKAGDSLTIPASAFDELTRQSKLLVSRALQKLHSSPSSFLQFYQYYLPAPNDMENIHEIASIARTMYPDLVDQFSSTMSAREVQTYLDFKSYGGRSAIRKLTEDLLASTNPYDFLGM